MITSVCNTVCSRRFLFCAKNSVTIGLLLYIVHFQMIIFHSSRYSGSNEIPSQYRSVSSMYQFTKPQENSQWERDVGVWPYHRPVTPVSPTNPVEWKPFSKERMKIPYPVFVTSLPKSGTTSIWKFAQCGNQLAAHNWITKIGARRATLLGQQIEKNIMEGRPPFENCGENDVFTDTGYLNYDHDPGLQCFFPSTDGLDAIYNSYPKATFINVVRNTHDWYQSLKTWSHASLFVRMRLCNATGFPNGQSTKKEFMAFYDAHNEMIRRFVRDRPSLTYIEIELESPDTGRILEEATGIPADCWRKCKPDQRQCEGENPQ